jgi:predicted nucleic acid-binding protein
MNLVLDTGVLGQLCHLKPPENFRVSQWLSSLLDRERELVHVFIPEIADYELRRKLLHLIPKKQASPRSLQRLDRLESELEYLALDTATMKHAAELWAISRQQGHPTADIKALDGDVILAAQALSVDGVVVTSNRNHLERFVPTKPWSELS